MRPLSYDERLKSLHLYSVQRRFERYIIIYSWKILESIVSNLSQPITCYFSDRRGRLCHLEHVCAGRLGTLSYNSFRWKAVRLFNCLPQHVRNVSFCSTIIFKKKLDQFLCNLDDKPCTPHFDNSVVHVTKQARVQEFARGGAQNLNLTTFFFFFFCFSLFQVGGAQLRN